MFKKFNFWKKFSHYFIILLSAVFLFAFSQQMVVSGNLLKQGPDSVLADEEQGDVGEPNNGYDTGIIPLEPAPAQPAAPPAQPAQPAAPAPNCNPVFQYNECIACNTSRAVYTDSCSGAYSTGGSQSDAQCASWCSAPAAPPAPAQPAAPPAQPAAPAPAQPSAPTCATNDQLYTQRRCQPGTTQMCTYNRWRGSDCSEDWGGAYDCQNDPACGYSNPTPPGPAAPSCNNGQTGGTCGNSANPCGGGGAGKCDACNGGWCNNGQCSTCSAPAGGPVACVPNGSCSAQAPSCGQTTSGVDNCGNSCSKQGGVCGCTPNGSCSAPNPTCGQTTTGVDNCNNTCTRRGGACQETVGPASCDFSPRYVNTNIGVNTGFSATYNPGANSNRVASSYTWTFGDNSGSFFGSYSTHSYSTTGNFPINLTITANTGESVTCSGSANIQSNNQCRSITCTAPNPGCSYTGQITYTCDPNVALTCGTQTCNPNNQNLVCTITASPQSGTAPLNVTLNGSATGGSGSYTYAWELDGNGSYNDAVTQSTSKIYNTSTNVSLKITDSANANSTYICYSNIAVTTPVIGQGYCTLTASPSNINPGGSVNLTATYNPNGSTATAQSYSYNFGDGVTSSTGTHVYQQAGNYYPSVTVTDTLGRQVNCAGFVSVNPQGAVVAPPVTFVNVGVGTSASYYYAGVQQLPKTGLPALAWVAGAFLPAGLGFKKFGKVKKSMENHPSYIWENRQFKA